MRSLHIQIIILFVALFRYDIGMTQISPGELSDPHAELEGISNCVRCHDVNESLSGDRCLECHKEIKVQFDDHTGFHWKIREKEGRNSCSLCHAEHNGREFELIYWEEGIEKFVHNKTGFELEGKHSTRKCRDCHRRKNIVKALKDLNPDLNLDRTFLGLGRECVACHKDIHLSQFERRCSECHGMESWRPAPLFTHDRSRYPLRGKHRSVPCEKCHIRVEGNSTRGQDGEYTQYAGLTYHDCTACHNYRHRSDIGGRCDSCHTPDGWRSVDNTVFDHRKTRFVLRGRHRTITCESCHGDGARGASLEFERCDNCHRDIHLSGFRSERFDGRCELCHGEDRFVPSMFDLSDHDQSPYPLTGAHRAVPCTVCHPEELGSDRVTFRRESGSCSSCHKDPHRGQFRQEPGYRGCESCHDTSGWDSLTFDHGKTKFPLDGRHINVRCKACHARTRTVDGEEFVRYTSLDRSCRGCHGDEPMKFPGGKAG